jgi:hypothetical protein
MMKKNILLIVSLITSFICKGQVRAFPDTSKIQIAKNLWAKPGAYYVDLAEVDIKKVYLDPENIEDIQVIKGEDAKFYSGDKGVTVLTRKTKTKLLTLGDIATQVSNDSLKSFKFIIDDMLIGDTTNVRLESTVIQNIEILRNTTNKVDHGFSRSVYILLTTTLKRKD